MGRREKLLCVIIEEYRLEQGGALIVALEVDLEVSDSVVRRGPRGYPERCMNHCSTLEPMVCLFRNKWKPGTNYIDGSTTTTRGVPYGPTLYLPVGTPTSNDPPFPFPSAHPSTGQHLIDTHDQKTHRKELTVM